MEPDPDLLFYTFDLIVQLSLSGLVISIIILLFLLLASAMISGSEIAFFSIKAVDLSTLEEEKSKTSKRIIDLLREPGKLLATILITNNLVNIGIVILASLVLDNLLPKSVYLAFANWINTDFLNTSYNPETFANFLNLLITVVAVTYLLVLFGEVAPKIYANFNKIKFAKAMAQPLHMANRVFGPLSKTLVFLSQKMENQFGSKSNLASIKEDIDHAIELTVNNETDEEQEANILKGIISFSELTVKQIMCPRTDIVGVDISSDFYELIRSIKDSGYSRIPIYEEDLDKIVGILYAKDLIGYLDKDVNFDWRPLIRKEILYAPESKKVNDHLKDIQSKRMHMAIVVDEYGGSSGIITLEDIMEEVVGDIRDEFDEDEDTEYVRVDDKNFIFDGKTNLQDVIRFANIESDIFEEIRGESDTLAGLVLEIVGQFPKVDREILLDNIRLKIVLVSKKRIEKISLHILD